MSTLELISNPELSDHPTNKMEDEAAEQQNNLKPEDQLEKSSERQRKNSNSSSSSSSSSSSNSASSSDEKELSDDSNICEDESTASTNPIENAVVEPSHEDDSNKAETPDAPMDPAGSESPNTVEDPM